jgi:hypothetical protein
MPALSHKLIVDAFGNPQEVVISLELFRQMEEVLGADLTPEEEAELREAIQDSNAGNRTAFVSMDDLLK